MTHKKVSVVIPLYNSVPFIDKTLEAVFQSTYPDFEVVLVDDGSTDNTREVLEKNGWMEKVKYIYQENSGISSARNTGILASAGYYVSLLDHDDLPLPEKLNVLAHYLQKHPEFSMVYTSVIMEGEHADIRKPSNERWVLRYEGDLFESLFYRKNIAPSSTLFIRQSIIDAGLFDKTYKIGEDREFLLRYSLKYLIGYIDRPLTKYSWRFNNTSVRWKNIIPDYEIKMFRQYKDELIGRSKHGRKIYNKSMANGKF